ncbi:MAG: hypothetical protein U1F66_02665 [bacterium]
MWVRIFSFLSILFTVILIHSTEAFASVTVGDAHLTVKAKMLTGVPNSHAAIYNREGVEINIFNLLGGEPILVAAGNSANIVVRWYMLLYRDCENAVFASDPDTPFVDPNFGMGPCEFLQNNFGLDISNNMAWARDTLNHIQISFTFDGGPRRATAQMIRPLESYMRTDGSISYCEEDYEYLFAALAEEFDYLDPNGKSPKDTCIAKTVSLGLGPDLLTVGTHSLTVTYIFDFEGDPVVMNFPAEIIVE